MRFKFVFCSKPMKTIQTIKITLVFLMQFLLIMLLTFYSKIIPFFFPFEIIERITCFSYGLNHKQDIFFFFLAYKTLIAIFTLFFSDFFESSFSYGKLFLPVIFIFKWLNLCYCL